MMYAFNAETSNGAEKGLVFGSDPEDAQSYVAEQLGVSPESVVIIPEYEDFIGHQYGGIALLTTGA
ncbi:hypothetical protein [Uliginosibacterium gangwonense]|uniref:hypothetical protein n=1 Tax=Uliginosibacterium gangwonense TaxID=392736 RepID=UPI000363FFA4|nr:hypothetical protein [Uliginosibacterium gangwonense]